MATATTSKPINLYQLGQEIGGPPSFRMIDNGTTRTIKTADVGQSALDTAVAAHVADFGIVPPPTDEEITAGIQGTNTTTLQTKARQAIADNIASIAIVPAAVAKVQGVIDGTAANLSQANAALDELAVVLRGLLNDYERMLRQLVAVERLIVGSDLLNDTDGT